MATGETTVNWSTLFSDDGLLDAPRTFHSLATHSTRDHLSLLQEVWSTPSRDCHVQTKVPPDGEGGAWLRFKLRELCV